MAGRFCDNCGTFYVPGRWQPRYCCGACGAKVGIHPGAVKARRAGLPGRQVPRFWLFERDGWMCYLCGHETLRVIGAHMPLSPTFDHVIPLSDRTSPGHVASNIRTTHLLCNRRKGNRSLEEYRARWGPATVPGSLIAPG